MFDRVNVRVCICFKSKHILSSNFLKSDFLGVSVCLRERFCPETAAHSPVNLSVAASGDGNPFSPYADTGGEIRQTLRED